jgi:type I restriction enzyme S subunit
MVPVVPDQEQEAIEQKLTALDYTISKTEAELDALSVLKTGLLQDLLTGKVRVSV